MTEITQLKKIEILKTNRDVVWDAIFAAIDVEKNANLKQAAKIVGNILDSNNDSILTVNGKLHETIAQKLDDIKLTEQQYVKLAEITTLLIHTEKATNFATAYNDEKIDIIGDTVKKLKKGGLSASKIAQHFSQITMDDVLTMHPTYVGTEEYTELLQGLETAIESGNNGAINETAKRLLAIDSVVKKKRTAEGENNISLHFLTNAYNAIPELYRKFDKALEQTDEEKWKFTLNIKQRSWGLGGGDKDGNSNVFADTMEQGIMMNRSRVSQLLQENFDELAGESKKFRDSDNYKEIQEALEKLSDLNPYENNLKFIEKTHIKIAYAMEEVFFDESSSKEAKEIAIAIKRKLSGVGLTMGRIEFRETADVHTHILDNILPRDFTEGIKYSQLDDDKRKIIINELLHNPDAKKDLKKWLAEALDTVPEESKPSYDYDEDNGNKGIFYTTIKRLELAAANPDMIKSQVLAEADSPLQAKEMLVLLRATDNEKNIRIIPLFEDPKILKKSAEITRELLEDPEYFKHLVEISLDRWDKKAQKGIVEELDNNIRKDLLGLNPQFNDFTDNLKTINKELVEHHGIDIASILKVETQIAHSDNTRRGGTTAAKGGIFKAHQDIRKTSEEMGFGANFHEGGSHTDSLRMGLRSEIGMIKLYGLYDFVKSTIQGIDSIMMNNSMGRFVSRHLEMLCHCALKLNPERGKTGERLLMGKLLERQINKDINQLDYISASLIEGAETYQDKFFTDDRFGMVLAQVLNYEQNKQDGNVGLRAAGRDEKNNASLYLNPVTGTRTIGFSETGQHNNLHFGFLGAGNLRKNLIAAVRSEESSKTHVQGLGNKQSTKSMTDTAVLKHLYDNSPAVRSAINAGAAYGTAATNMDDVWRKAMSKELKIINPENREVTGTETITERPKPSQLKELAKTDSIAGFLAKTEIEYRKSVSLAYVAITGKKLDISNNISTAKLTAQIRNELPEYKQRLERQDIVIAFTDYLSDKVGENSRTLHNTRAFSLMVPPMVTALKRFLGIIKSPNTEQSVTR